VCACERLGAVAPSSRFLVVGSWRLPTTDKLSLAEVRWLCGTENGATPGKDTTGGFFRS